MIHDDHAERGAARELLTVTKAAEALSLSRSKTYQLVANGQLGSVTIGRSRRVSRGTLNQFIDDLVAALSVKLS